MSKDFSKNACAPLLGLPVPQSAVASVLHRDEDHPQAMGWNLAFQSGYHEHKMCRCTAKSRRLQDRVKAKGL